MARKQFAEGFKSKAVRHVIKRGYTVTDVANKIWNNKKVSKNPWDRKMDDQNGNNPVYI